MQGEKLQCPHINKSEHPRNTAVIKVHMLNDYILYYYGFMVDKGH